MDIMSRGDALFKECRTIDDINGLRGLLKRRESEIGNDAMRAAIEAGFVPGARVAVIWSGKGQHIRTKRDNERQGTIDSPHAQTFRVRLDCGRNEPFTPQQLRLLNPQSKPKVSEQG